MRDRRFDFLYEREKQPVKAYVLERFAGELARELEAWPPPFLDWVSEELRARWSAGAAERPRDDVLRFALELARLDLLRDFEGVERRLAEDAHRLQTPAEGAALHLLVRLVTEKCLGLKEHADRVRIGREDLVAMIDDVERRLFRVTLG
ncbi:MULTISPECIES: hypothetical protein [Anaeromyxobacter]|uniref:hypothetical protein n=1 Tax=Anaeromyxobacter TaxID=161492 RepID=UPI001F5A5981|nr:MULTISPECIES: hypothetical protein [unclassified Anaeromyxobacter]